MRLFALSLLLSLTGASAEDPADKKSDPPSAAAREVAAVLAEVQKAGAVTINYGKFLNAVVSFVIVAFAVFMLIRAINQLKRKEEAAPTTKECPQCFSAISIKAKRCPNCTSQL